MRGRQRLDARKARQAQPLDRPDANHQRVGDALVIGPGGNVRVRQQRLDFRRKGDESRRYVEIEGPHADRIAREDEAPQRAVEQTQREIAGEPLDEALVPLLVGLEHASRVARARRQIQQPVELVAVVEAAVECEHDATAAHDRLPLADLLDRHPEMLVREADRLGDMDVAAVGPAVRERLVHRVDDRRAERTAIPVPDADNSAQIVLVAARV